MKVLVSGANGFIGRALCSYLIFLGHSVVPAVRRPCSIDGEYVVGDRHSWMQALTGCSSVVHLAGRVHVMHEIEKEPLRAFQKANVDATLELAKRAVDSGAKRFVFMITIKVNGDKTSPGSCFKPDDLPAPMDAYAISKWEAELQLIKLAEASGLEVVIIRPPLVYGPGARGNLSSLIRWVKREVPLPLGRTNNLRSMIALENLVDFTALCADIEASPNASGQVFLISDGEDVSTSELIHRLAKAYDCNNCMFSVSPKIIRLVARLIGKSASVDRLLGSLVIDGSKARWMLGWHPIVSLDEQLKRIALQDHQI